MPHVRMHELEVMEECRVMEQFLRRFGIRPEPRYYKSDPAPRFQQADVRLNERSKIERTLGNYE